MQTLDLITREDLEQFRLRLLEDLKKVQAAPVARREWLRGSEVRKLLKISPGTLQTLRVSDKLHPSKLGGIFYYRYEEIEGLLENGGSKPGVNGRKFGRKGHV